MSDYAKNWLNAWVERRVTAGPFQQQKRLASETYAPACLSDANRAGITRRELEAAADGSLVAFIENAIEDKTDIEVRKNRPA